MKAPAPLVAAQVPAVEGIPGVTGTGSIQPEMRRPTDQRRPARRDRERPVAPPPHEPEPEEVPRGPTPHRIDVRI